MDDARMRELEIKMLRREVKQFEQDFEAEVESGNDMAGVTLLLLRSHKEQLEALELEAADETVGKLLSQEAMPDDTER